MPRRPTHRRLSCSALLAVAAVALGATHAAAQTNGSWNVDANGNWSTASNWLGNTIADGLGATATFSTNITTTRTITLDASRTIGNLIFSDNGGSGSAWILSGANTLTLSGTNGSPIITTSTNVTINSTLSGTQGLVKDGTATLILTSNNTYAGGTTIAAGVLQVGNGGTTGSINGSITINGTLIINRSDDYGLGAGYSGSGNLILAGSGRTIMTGILDHTGGTTISGGTLQFGNYSLSPPSVGVGGNFVNNGIMSITMPVTITGSISGTGAVSVSGNTILTGTNTYSGITTIGSGMTTGAALRATDGLSLPTQSNLTFNGGPPDVPRLETSGNFTRTLGTGAGQVRFVGSGGFRAVDADLTVNLGGAGGQVTFGGANFIPSGSHFELGSAASNLKTTFVNAINLGGASQTLRGQGVAEISGAISNGGLNVSHSGTVILSGTNTYAGGTTIASFSTLQIGNGGTSGSIAGNVTNTGTLAFNRSDTLTYNGVISGAGRVVQAGPGTTILAGTNSYTGGTTISAGKLQIGDGGTIGSITGNVVNNGALVISRSNAINISGNISGTGSLHQVWTGTTTLSGANTYSGVTTITAGTLQLGNNAALQNSTVYANNSGLKFGTGVTAPSIGALSGTGNIALSTASSQAVALGVGSNDASTTYSGNLSGSGSLRKVGAGILVLTGSNTYFGGTTISAGTLQLGDGGTTGTILGNVVNNGTLVFNFSSTQGFSSAISGTGGVVQAGTGKLSLNNAPSYSGPTTIAAGTLVGDISAASNLVLAGGINEINGSFNRPLGTAAGQLQWVGSGGFSSVTSLTINLGGSGQQVVWAQNSFVPDGGTLSLIYAPESAPISGTSVTKFVNAIDLNGGNRTVQATGPRDSYFAISGIQILSSRAELAGVISNGGLTKTGDGLLVLSATNTYAGGTTIAGGTLRAKEGIGLPTTGNLTLAGGMFETTGNFNRSLGDGDGQVRWTSSGGFSSFNGTVTTASLTVNLGGSAAPVTWNQGAFVPDGAALMFDSFNKTTFVNPIDLNNGTRTITALSGTSVISGTISNGGLVKTGQGTLQLTAQNSFAGGLTIAEGSVLAMDGVGLPTASNLVLGDNAAFETNGVFTRSIGTGPGEVQWTGNGGLGANGGDLTVNIGGDYRQLVWAQGGFVPNFESLRLVSSGTDATTNFANPIDLNDGSRTIFVGRSNSSVEVSGVISNGSLTVSGADALYLSGQNSYAGGTTVSAGVLRAVDGVGLPTAGNLTLNSGVLESNGTFVRSLGSGPGQVQWVGSGGFEAVGGNLIVNLGNDSRQLVWGQGGFLTSSGSLQLAASLSRADSKTTFVNPIDLNGATRQVLVYDNVASTNDVAEIAGVLSNGALQKQGAGKLILSATNTYSGGTTISGGTLQIGNGGTTGAVLGNVVNNGALIFNRSNTSSFAGVISGNGGVTKLGGGLLTFGGASTYTGGTTVGAGTLELLTGAQLRLDGGILVASGASFIVDNGASLVGTGTVGGAGVFRNNGSLSGNLTADSGAVVQGNGTISGTVTVNGGATLSPGNSVGQLTVGNLTLNSTTTDPSLTVFEFRNPGGSSPGTDWDSINVTNLLTINATAAAPMLLSIDSWLADNSGHGGGNGFDPSLDYHWLWMQTGGISMSGLDPIASRFTILDSQAGQGVFGAGNPYGTKPIGAYFEVSITGNNLFLDYHGASAVPEPGSCALAAVAAAAGSWYRRRRSRKQTQVEGERQA